MVNRNALYQGKGALIQGDEPLLLERMGQNWIERAQMVAAILSEALPWMDDNVAGYIGELAMRSEYISKRARLYWSYLRPVRFQDPDWGRFEHQNVRRRRGRGNALVQYNPPIQGPLGRVFQIPGMVLDSDFNRFRNPVAWVEYKFLNTVLAIAGSFNRPSDRPHAILVRQTRNFINPPNPVDSREYNVEDFYGRDEAYWSSIPYTQYAKHPYPPRRWWGPGTIFVQPGMPRSIWDE